MNIRKMMHEGKRPRKQIIAITMSKAGKLRKRKKEKGKRKKR